jgi:hypothetical protein
MYQLHRMEFFQKEGQKLTETYRERERERRGGYFI